MIASKTELFAVLSQFNPWWSGGRSPDLPTWRRAAFREIEAWAQSPPGGRALLLSGARQVGKTTLFLQQIDRLLTGQATSPANILYATFDHPLLKLLGLEDLIKLWREFEPAGEGPEYLFLDEIHMAKDWQTWIKHQVDFSKKRRIAVTGSATPLATEGQESGVGRWQTIKLATLSFFEYLQLRKQPDLPLPPVISLRDPFEWNDTQRAKVATTAEPLIGLFHEYLLRGGFPQSAMVATIPLAQKLLREDIVDKVLKRDMTAFFQVRRVLALEQLFIYLCLHDGGLLDIKAVCSALGENRQTVETYIGHLEAAHLIYRLRAYGYGKEVLRGRSKIYLADAAIGPSVLLKGKELLADPIALGRAVETAFFKHIFTRYYAQSVSFSYWQGKKDHEVDLIADIKDELIPFEIKYRDPSHTQPKDLKGLAEFCGKHALKRAYVITRDLADFRVQEITSAKHKTRLLNIPAPLACYWLGRSEIE